MRGAWRLRGMGKMLRKAAGLMLAVVGIGIIVETLPTYLLLIMTGILLIFCGWMLFGVDRKRWI